MNSLTHKISKELKAKIDAITGTKATVMSYAYAKIFTKDLNSSGWMNSKLEGYLCLIYDRSWKGPILRMFHPKTCCCLFECEMYYNFDKAYVTQDELFHFFCIPKGFIGISYADAKQAKRFAKKVKKFSIQKKINPTQYQQARSRQGVIIGRSRDQEISYKPTNVVHKGGFSFALNNKNEIDPKKLPKQYRKILKAAGVRKKDLKDQNMVPIIMKQLEDLETSDSSSNKNIPQAPKFDIPKAPKLFIPDAPMMKPPDIFGKKEKQEQPQKMDVQDEIKQMRMKQQKKKELQQQAKDRGEEIPEKPKKFKPKVTLFDQIKQMREQIDKKREEKKQGKVVEIKPKKPEIKEKSPAKFNNALKIIQQKEKLKYMRAETGKQLSSDEEVDSSWSDDSDPD